MNGGDTNWGQSVAGVAMVGGRVLLARHTYGSGRGRLIIPGGYVDRGETPQEALRREFLEETGVVVEPAELIGVRFNMRDWYAVFRAEYVSGEARPDGDENDEVVWMDAAEALARDDVPDLTKKMIVAAGRGGGLAPEGYDGPTEPGPYSLYMSPKSNSIGDSVSIALDEASQTVSLEKPDAYTFNTLMAGYEGPKPGEIDAPGESVGEELR